MNAPTIISNIENMAGWIQPPNVGDTGGGSTLPPGTFVMAAKTDTTAVTLSGNPGHPYNNGYYYLPLPGDWSSTETAVLEYDLDLSFPTALDFKNSQAQEWEIQQNVGNTIYNMAWQSRPGGNLYQFNYATSAWEETYIPSSTLNFAPGNWNTFSGLFLVNPTAKTVTHLAAVINGVIYLVNVTKPGVAQTSAPYLHVAVQIDGNAVGDPYSMQIRNLTVKRQLVTA